jgi:hypothetical protein
MPSGPPPEGKAGVRSTSHIESFGRPDEPAEPAPAAPVVQIAPVEVPVILVVDGESMRRASQHITEMVLGAVRAGYATAWADIEFEAEHSDDFENPSAQFRATLKEFVEENDEALRRLTKND